MGVQQKPNEGPPRGAKLCAKDVHRLAAGVDHKVSRLRCVGKGAWKEEAENKSKKVGEQWQGLLIL
ncbi:hypothetical protein MGG_16824 [Pyricularia oryzae 70-15]|uniref:Uncharacterized protein n=2 Tax=Pyricularia oryzae TaxID=318829 RepID=G4N338_PYRO7|nr:uncharacterized protein MGG_16824 [Pyricularia oryzae 70-15]EHA52594.1 hypothetical protein MGG_16824 [Pyricularia oryzae 70-15]